MTGTAGGGASGTTVLHAYGPGGPYLPMKACGELFTQATGVRVITTKGVPSSWIGRARQDADLIYGGAEYMLPEYESECPGLIDMTAVANLFPRRVGIIVRKGNPKVLSSPEDLGVGGLRVLDVQLERMEPFQRAARRAGNIARSVVTGEEGRTAWLTEQELDAWITYRSWHVTMRDEAEFLPILGPPDSLRFTPVALARRTPHRQLAADFVGFLRSEATHRIFAEHGWE